MEETNMVIKCLSSIPTSPPNKCISLFVPWYFYYVELSHGLNMADSTSQFKSKLKYH